MVEDEVSPSSATLFISLILADSNCLFVSSWLVPYLCHVIELRIDKDGKRNEPHDNGDTEERLSPLPHSPPVYTVWCFFVGYARPG